MKKRFHTFFLAAAMLVLILDSKTAMSGALKGLELCLNSMIPSLFALFVLTSLLISNSGNTFPFLRPIGKLCGIPQGCECLLLTAFLGGYPLGAQSVAQLYEDGRLTKTNAQRLLGFCNNAGPSFLFGIVAVQLDDPMSGWLIWFIQILSALTVGFILPGKENAIIDGPKTTEITVSVALENSIRSLCKVCGWVILFRVLIAYLDRWLLWLLPAPVQVLISGLFELTNGCLALRSIQSTKVRFVISSALLSMGGMSVATQTSAVTGALGLGMYLPGKLLQTLISTLLALLVCSFGMMPLALSGILGMFFVIVRKSSRNSVTIGV